MGTGLLKILAIGRLLFADPVEYLALRYAGCHVITIPVGPDTVAVKWVCDR